MKDKVSVQIILAYFWEYEYFCEALKSTMAQDYPYFSVIVIDDGTHDVRINKFIENLNDSRITLIVNDTNVGIARTFEKGRAISTADFLVFLGQDDILEKNYLSSLVPLISANPYVALAQPSVRVIDSLGREYRPLTDKVKWLLSSIAQAFGEKITFQERSGSLIKGQSAISLLLVGNFLYFPTLMWRSEYLGKFDVSREITLDYKMIIDVLGRDGEILLVANKCARYRRHERSASMDPKKMIERLMEERLLHHYFRTNPKIIKSKLLKVLNSARITHRMHVLQIALAFLAKFDLPRAARTLKCLF
jgi:glycosyltransferase involved in cell wall biosynthesis